MNSMVLATAISIAILPLSASSGAVLTVGGPLSQLCYESALSADGRRSALEGCTRALQEESLRGPDLAATYVNRGIVLMSGRHFNEADSDFDSALRLNDALPDAWLNKGFLRLRQGNGQEALPLIQKGMDSGAGNQALAFFARGVAHEQMGDFSLAYADLKRAQQLEPGWALPKEYLASYRVVKR